MGKTINITIRDKIAVADEDVMYICGNSDFVVHFDFDEEWEAYKTKTARFIKTEDRSYADVLFDGNECPVPVLSGTYNILVGVFAGDLVTTTPALVSSKRSILCGSGSPANPPADIYNQLMEKLNSLSDEGLAGTVKDLEQQIADIEEWIDNKDYGDGILITSFSHDAGTREMGSSIKSLNLKWVLNRTPVTLTLNGEALDVNARSKPVDGLNITMDKATWPKWTLTATDNRNKVVSSSVSSFTFLNGVYWGTAAQPEAIDSEFIRGLKNKRLSSGKVTSITVNATDGEYIWYCLPKRMGTCVFVYGANEVGFELIDADGIEFTNDSGYMEKYYVYRNANDGLGSVTLGVK